ncbi:MAG: hypothetical protein GOP50_00870 [Candidatus Heimdallarchaeota archaeon]|nr:hypothetical protein [Candidatus Heimdallarchaeota archaeon]
MNEHELSRLLDQEIRDLQKELSELKRARRTLRAKARSERLLTQRIPLAG